jgi:phosphoribosylformimino-5-aminoimidazole carboxamide ribotide isomerase
MSAVRSLVDKFPEIAFWLDSGARSVAPESPVETIVGSETMRREAPPPDLSAEPRAILSLDFQNGNFLGPPALAASPRLWPARVIVMTLERVGLGNGLDFATLAAIKARAGGRELFAAGGVRGAEDLAALAGRGVAGALTASALHDGRLAPRDLARFAGSTPGG